MPLCPQSDVQVLLGLDGLVHVVQLLQQLPAVQRVAYINHATPDHHCRRHRHQCPRQRKVRNVPGGHVHVQHNDPHHQDL